MTDGNPQEIDYKKSIIKGLKGKKNKSSLSKDF